MTFGPRWNISPDEPENAKICFHCSIDDQHWILFGPAHSGERQYDLDSVETKRSELSIFNQPYFSEYTEYSLPGCPVKVFELGV